MLQVNKGMEVVSKTTPAAISLPEELFNHAILGSEPVNLQFIVYNQDILFQVFKLNLILTLRFIYIYLEQTNTKMTSCKVIIIYTKKMI